MHIGHILLLLTNLRRCCFATEAPYIALAGIAFEDQDASICRQPALHHALSTPDPHSHLTLLLISNSDTTTCPSPASELKILHCVTLVTRMLALIAVPAPQKGQLLTAGGWKGLWRCLGHLGHLSLCT